MRKMSELGLVKAELKILKIKLCRRGKNNI